LPLTVENQEDRV